MGFICLKCFKMVTLSPFLFRSENGLLAIGTVSDKTEKDQLVSERRKKNYLFCMKRRLSQQKKKTLNIKPNGRNTVKK